MLRLLILMCLLLHCEVSDCCYPKQSIKGPKYPYTRKDLFFDIVESGLRDRYESQEISRIFKFCDYARGKLAIPDHLTVPFQEVIPEYIEGLTSRPWWDSTQFEWCRELEERSSIIRSELTNVLNQNDLFRADSKFSTTMGAGWTAIRLRRLGSWIPENLQMFPKTTTLLQSLNIPFSTRGVMFARQLASTGVQSHSDGRNFILTAHLGLIIPKDGCSITVATETKEWKENKILILDTSFIHKTQNHSKNEDRYVLIIDFWHPELSLHERDALEFVYDTSRKFEAGLFEQIDCSYIREGKSLDVEELNRKLEEQQNPIVRFLNFRKIF